MNDEKNTTVEQEQEVLQITAGELALLVKIIDAGSERGAWKGEELGVIGTIRTKMVKIVQSVAPVEDTAAKEAKEAEDKDEIVTEEPPKAKTKKRGSKSAAV